MTRRRSSFVSVALGVAWRTLHNVFTTPSLLLPSLLFPLLNFTAFAGGLSSLTRIENFEYEPGYTGFQFVFVLLQSAAFGGVFTAFGIARDFEYGFAKRLLLAAPHRSSLVAGYALAAAVRWLFVAVVVTVVALVAGMQVAGNGIDLVALYSLALIAHLAGMMWATGVALRFRSIQAGPLMQMPVFTVLFLAPVYVPQALLEGWIEAVANVNPVTRLLEAGRSLLAGDPHEVGMAFAIAAGLVSVLALWALRGLRRAEAAG
jgi:ABC-2 type transport system permease protein